MQISAWKCEQTGQLFELESDYLAHRNNLDQDRRRALALPSAGKELELIQTSLSEVKSAQELITQLIPAYAAALEAMVRHGMTSPDEAEIRISRIETVSLECGPIDPDAALELNADPYSTKGIAGALEFIFSGPVSPPEALNPLRLFPLLQGGKKTPFDFNSCKSSHIRGFWHFTAYIFVFIEHLPRMKPLLEEYLQIENDELVGLRTLQAREEVRLSSVDDVIMQVSQEKATVDGQVRALIAQREQLEQTLKDRARKLSICAVDSIPRLKRYYDLMELLRIG